MSITFGLIQLARKERKDGRIPVYIRVTKDRKHRYKSTGIAVARHYWDDEEKVIKRSHQYSSKLNNKLKTMITVFESRVEKLEKKGTASLDNLKLELENIVNEYASQPGSVYNTGGKSLEAAKKIVEELKNNGFQADHYYFEEMRIIAFVKMYEIDDNEGDLIEVANTRIFKKEELENLFKSPTLIKDLVQEIIHGNIHEMKDFKDKTDPFRN